MRNVLSGVLPVTLLLLSGCSSGVSYMASDQVALEPKPSAYEMPMSPGTPARAHREIGTLSITMAIKPSYRETSTYDQCLEKMKAEAVKRGADAVVAIKTIDSQEEASQGRLTLTGTLIIFTAPEAIATKSGK